MISTLGEVSEIVPPSPLLWACEKTPAGEVSPNSSVNWPVAANFWVVKIVTSPPCPLPPAESLVTWPPVTVMVLALSAIAPASPGPPVLVLIEAWSMLMVLSAEISTKPPGAATTNIRIRLPSETVTESFA